MLVGPVDTPVGPGDTPVALPDIAPVVGPASVVVVVVVVVVAPVVVASHGGYHSPHGLHLVLKFQNLLTYIRERGLEDLAR